MKRFYKTRLSAIVLFAALMMPLAFYGQNKTTSPFEKYIYLNANGGITQYFGDINKDDFYNKIEIIFKLSVYLY